MEIPELLTHGLCRAPVILESIATLLAEPARPRLDPREARLIGGAEFEAKVAINFAHGRRGIGDELGVAQRQPPRLAQAPSTT